MWQRRLLSGYASATRPTRRARRLATGAALLAGGYLADEHLFHRNAQRFCRTALAGAMIVADYKLFFNEAHDPGALHERVATRILRTCQKNGGLYVKFGQGVASMNHVLPEEYSRILTQLQDRAECVGYDAVEKLFCEEFDGLAPDDVFLEFDREPIASASIAQVHRAKLKDGTPVAVKVQKPYIQGQMPFDLFAHRIVLFVFETLFDLPLRWSAPYIEKHLNQEVDFVREAQNGERTLNALRGEFGDSVYVPKTYWEQTRKRVMTSEWIDGIKITHAKTLRDEGFSISGLLTRFVQVFAHQIFISGFVHCDPHPGNILIRWQPKKSRLASIFSRKQPQIVLLDHGLYIDETPQFRHAYAALWESIFLLDTAQIAKLCKSWGVDDSQYFVSAQLMKPFNPNKAVHVQRDLTMGEVYAMQREAKDRIRRVLKDTSKLPRELIFVGRNMNLVRSVNKELGSLVNRPNIMSRYAVRGINEDTNEFSTTSMLRRWRFELALWGMSAAFNLTQAWRWLNWAVLGRRVDGFEDVLESGMNQTMAKFGMRKLNSKTFDA